jgi:hypothetical protein
MRIAICLAALGYCALLRADERVQKMTERLSEEAAVFSQQAPNIIAQETLRQRALKPPQRGFHPKIGKAATEPAKPEWQQRDLVSEYGFAKFSSGSVHEMRRVVTVDGRAVEKSDQALDALARSITSTSDEQKRAALQEFEKLGLRGAATDFGQLLLMFGRTQIPKYEFDVKGSGLLGAEQALIFRYKQMEGKEGLTIFEGDKPAPVHQRLEGEIWARQSDYLPLRITLVSVRGKAMYGIRDEAQVDYILTSYGFLAPASVVHRELRSTGLVAENVFQYSSFKKFGSSAEIKFTETPEPPK